MKGTKEEEEDLPTPIRRKAKAKVDLMLGRDEDITPVEAGKKKACELVLRGDLSIFLKDATKDMAISEIRRIIQEDIIPALCSGTVCLWNVSRWKQNKKSSGSCCG